MNPAHKKRGALHESRIMKRLITTIALFCFSTIINADIYVCESEIDADIFAPEVLPGSKADRDSAIYFIVDTEKGVRESNGNKHTIEPCRISGDLLICMSLYEGIGLNSFAINTVDDTFTYVEQNYRVRISSYYGTCIKGS